MEVRRERLTEPAAKVALVVPRENATIVDLGKRLDAHANQIMAWKARVFWGARSLRLVRRRPVT
jgi:hypothetical protein